MVNLPLSAYITQTISVPSPKADTVSFEPCVILPLSFEFNADESSHVQSSIDTKLLLHPTRESNKDFSQQHVC